MTNSKDSNDLLSNNGNNSNENNSNSNSNQPSDDDAEMEYSFNDENLDCDIESEFTDIGANIDLVMSTLEDIEKNSNHLMEQAKQLLDEFRSQD